jgi:hypothetical protein
MGHLSVPHPNPKISICNKAVRISINPNHQIIMSLIGILFGIVFVALLTKAILETIYGVCLIIHGIACHILAAMLNLLAMCLRFGSRIRRKFQKKPRRPMTLGECIIVVNCPKSPEAKRILASLR